MYYKDLEAFSMHFIIKMNINFRICEQNAIEVREFRSSYNKLLYTFRDVPAGLPSYIRSSNEDVLVLRF